MARRLAEAAGKNAAPWLTFVRAPPIILLLVSPGPGKKKKVLRLLCYSVQVHMVEEEPSPGTKLSGSSRGCWQRECCSAERPGRQGLPSSSSDRSDDHPLPVSWRRVVSAGPAQWTGMARPAGTCFALRTCACPAGGRLRGCLLVRWCLPFFFFFVAGFWKGELRARQAGRRWPRFGGADRESTTAMASSATPTAHCRGP